MYSRPIVCVLSFFCCWYSVRMMARHQNLLYEEENERVQFSFNSQTLVPRLISRLGEREGNAMLNEKKRDGRKNPLPFIWYGNISCSHTLRGYENKRLGDGRDRGKRVRKGRGRKPGEMYRMICFSGKEEIEEEVRVGRWRRHRGRGDERGMKRERERDTGEKNLLHLALQLIPSGWDEEWDVVRAFSSRYRKKSAFDMWNVLGHGAADRQAGNHKDRWVGGEKQHGQTERQVVTVGVTSDRFRSQTAWQTGERETDRTNRNKPTSLHSRGITCPETHSPVRVCVCCPHAYTLVSFSSCVCVCICYISRESPAASLDTLNNHPTGSGALDSQTHTHTNTWIYTDMQTLYIL